MFGEKKMKKSNHYLKKITCLMIVLSIILTLIPPKVRIVKAAGYDVGKAIEYAQRFSDNKGPSEGWNHDKYVENYNMVYHDHAQRGGDCANFVSQCLAAGGLQPNQSWGVYPLNGRMQGNDAWISAPGLLRYLKTHYDVIENPSADQILP